MVTPLTIPAPYLRQLELPELVEPVTVRDLITHIKRLEDIVDKANDRFGAIEKLSDLSKRKV